MKTQSFIGQQQCLMYATIAQQVATGLSCVINDGVLPPYYQGVFRSAVVLCDDIVFGAYYGFTDRTNPCGAQVAEISQATIWFLGLVKCYPEICKDVLMFLDFDEVIDVLEFLASDSAHPHAYPDERIYELQAFFLALWDAVEQECIKEGIPSSFNLASFHEASENLQ